MRTVFVAVAGAAGALTRYGIGTLVGPQAFPWTTFAINVTGSYILGLLLTLGTQRHWSPDLTVPLAVGFLGAYTTFSTFSYETQTMLRTGRVGTAFVYVFGSLAFGVAAAAGGYATARAI